MDIETLFEMASAAARNAERNCGVVGSDVGYASFGGYPTYVNEYNRLAPFVHDLLGVEALNMFPLLDLGRQINPADVPSLMWKTYAELAASRLSALAAYLKSKQGTKMREHAEVFELLQDNLRAALYSDPENERNVQDIMETIFRVRGLSFRREQMSVPYSTKRYIPDFTFDALGLAVEAKLCNRASRVQELIDEMNADIVGYRGSYEKILFVVYDLGYVRDAARFRTDIEKNAGVSVLIVKK